LPANKFGMKRNACGEASDMKKFTRGFFLSAIAAGALIAGVIKFAAADSQGAAPSPAASPYVVSMKDFAFSPATIKVPVGATVRWKNDDSVAHTATSKAFDSGNLDSGRSFSFTFMKSGSYAYVCSYHQGMTGTVVVNAPAEAPASP
jgi:plastocyanin